MCLFVMRCQFELLIFLLKIENYYVMVYYIIWSSNKKVVSDKEGHARMKTMKNLLTKNWTLKLVGVWFKSWMEFLQDWFD